MIVQWLAPRLKKYDIKSVTSFGAAAYNEKVKGAKYEIFVEKEDFVAKGITTGITGKVFSVDSEQVKWIDDESKKWWNPLEAHNYSNNEELELRPIPFIPKEYTVVNSDELEPTIPVKASNYVQKKFSDVKETFVETVEGVLDEAREVTQTVEEQVQEISRKAVQAPSAVMEKAHNVIEDTFGREFTQAVEERVEEAKQKAAEFIHDMQEGIEAMRLKTPRL